MKTLSLALLPLLFVSCHSLKLPATAGAQENAVTFGYQPLDPLPIGMTGGADSLSANAANTVNPISSARILRSLPDETMRLATRQIDGSGGIGFGTAKLGYEGNNYEVILDYIKFETKPLKVQLSGKGDRTKPTDDYEFTIVQTSPTADAVLPAYIGVGLRLTATIRVNKGTVDLGNLFALSAAAQANKITGSLVIQTLGISGEPISPLIPLPSEISPSSIQNAILALSNIKAKMFEPNVTISPRILGFYNTLGGGEKTVNKIISSLLIEKMTLDIK